MTTNKSTLPAATLALIERLSQGTAEAMQHLSEEALLAEMDRGVVYLVGALYRPDTDHVAVIEPVPRQIDSFREIEDDPVLNRSSILAVYEDALKRGEGTAVIIIGLQDEPPPRKMVWGGAFNLPRRDAN